MWLKEMRYFKQVNCVFLIVGKTKNACDCLFNSLNHKYHKKNIFTMVKLIKALNVSKKIIVIPTVTSIFLNCDGAFKVLYADLKELVKNHHIFTCNGDNNKLIMTIRESNLDAHKII